MFEDHFAKAEEWLLTTGALPLIDDPGLDFSDQIAEVQSDYLDAIRAFRDSGTGVVFEMEPWEEAALVVPEPFSFAPPHDAANAAHRFVALAFLWKLSLTDPSTFGSGIDQIREDLRNVVRHKAPGKCDSVWQARWELASAALTGCWERVDPLTKSWSRIEPGDAATAIETASRIKVMSAFDDNSRFAGDSWIDYPHYPDLIREAVRQGFFDNSGPTDGRPPVAVNAVLPLGRDGSDLDWDLPKELAPEVAARVQEARTSLLMIEANGHELEPFFQALLAWSSLVMGLRISAPDLVREAAKRFEQILTEARLELPPYITASAIHRTLICCHSWAGSKDEARAWAQKWTAADPDNADAWHMLARCCRDTDDQDGALEAYEQFVRLSDSADTDWEATELLRLGLERRSHSRLLAEIERALSARERPTARAILALEWPAFSALCSDAQEKWWLGLAVACDPTSEATLGSHRWSLAVTPSAEALRIEFQRIVFSPFAEWLRTTHQLDQLRRSARPALGQGALRTLEKDRMALGQMLVLFSDAARKKGDLGPTLGRWLDANRPGVFELVRDKVVEEALDRVNVIRNTGTHNLGTVEEDWRYVYVNAKRVLEVLVAPQSEN